MLEKIVQIKSIGRFRNYNANGDVTFRKLTLVYAENGRGKTTLCAILRSLQTGQREFITERKTLASTYPEFVHLRLKNTNYQFINGAWTETCPDVIIFDPVFINENVYSGDFVEHEHKKNMYRVIVGVQGVHLAKQIEKLDGQIRDASTDIRIKKESIIKYIPPSITLEEYLKWQPLADIETQIRKKTDDLYNWQRATTKSAEIQAKEQFEKVLIPSFPSDFSTILAKQLTDIIDDAETRVRKQISQHDMGHQGEPWLSQGLGFIKNERCPFCGQDILANNLIEAYHSHFNAAYRDLKQEVALLSKRINSTIGEMSLVSAQQVIAGNVALAEFWKQFIKVDLPVISFPTIQQKYAKLRERGLALAKRKQDNPTEAIAADDEFTDAFCEVLTLQDVIASYNIVIDSANLSVNKQKSSVLSQNDFEMLKNELTELEARKKRFDQEINDKCQAYQGAVAAKESIEKSKESVRQQLDQHCRDLLRIYEQAINDYLDQFNTGFRITNTRHLYTGGMPSSHYQIEINNTALELGDARTPAGTPCFKTTLSSGDRSALALAFFLAVLKQDSEIGRKIVVFDDPFTSQDRFRRTCTQQLIQRLLISAQQVIVLSHDPHFLKLLSDECSTATNVKTLQMSKSGDTTIIGEWDIQEEVQSSYMRDFSTLLKFYRERNGDPRAIARAIRPFLEGMLRNHFPGKFQPNEWFGDMIGKIISADVTDGLQHAKADLSELEAINAYSRKYHHQQNEHADTEPLNDDELYSYVKRTLRLVGGS